MKDLTFDLKDILLIFNKNLLFNYYTHLGFKRQYLHQSFRKATLGFHNNIIVINYNYTLSNLRFSSTFLLKMMLENKKVVFVFYETPPEFLKNLFFRGHYHIVNKWPAGLLTNSITTLESEILWREGNFFPFLPNATFTVATEPEKAFIIVNESNKMGIPGFTVADSNYDLDFFPYWIPANTRSGYSKLFFFFYINSLIKKSDLIKKRDFLYFSRLDYFKRTQVKYEEWYKKLKSMSKKQRAQFLAKSKWKG